MQWSDSSGRRWIAKCTIGIAMALKDSGIDLMNPDQLAKLYSDPFEFLKLGAKLHDSAQMKDHGISETDLLDLMTETTEIAEASLNAVEAALADFFHRVRGGKPLAAVLQRAAEASVKTAEAQVEMILGEKGTAAIGKLIQDATKPLADKLEQLGSPAPTGKASGES